MDTILVFEKDERYQYMIDTSTILNSMKSIKLFVKYTFNEQFDDNKLLYIINVFVLQ